MEKTPSNHPKERHRQAAGQSEQTTGEGEQSAGLYPPQFKLTASSSLPPSDPSQRDPFHLSSVQPIQREVGGTELDTPNPEQTPIDITGRYEVINPDGANRITLQLNQAGHHFEGWYQRRRYDGRFDRATMRQMQGHGELIHQSTSRVSFSFDFSGSDGFTGELHVRRSGGRNVLTMESNTWSREFRQTSNRAAVSDEAIEAVPEDARDLVNARERAPLDSSEMSRVERSIGRITTRVRTYFETPDRNIVRDVKASNLNHYFEGLVGVFAREQYPVLKNELQNRLFRRREQIGDVSRSVWDWLLIMAANHPNYMEYFRNFFGIRQDGSIEGDAPQHRYKFSFEVVGLAGDVGIGLGGFLGQFTVEKVSPDTWTQNYFTVMGGVSGGLSAGVTVGQRSSSPEFETPFDWRSSNFAGSYVIASAGVGGALADTGGVVSGTAISFYGDETYPVLMADAGNFTEVFGAYIGAEVSETFGYMWGGRQEAIASARGQQRSTTSSSYRSGVQAHFEIDDPSLNDEGKALLRSMCATHRAAFSNQNSLLRIRGYASPSGSRQDERRQSRNTELSRLRAWNTLQSMRDFLGGAFDILDPNITVEGLGDGPALAAGIPAGQESDDWRKVDVEINGRLVLRLQG